jgi:hypothetical protein
MTAQSGCTHGAATNRGQSARKENPMTETAIDNAPTEAKTTKGKAPKKTSKTKAAPPKTKLPKAEKPKREKPPKEDLMVFAFRITKAESAALHQAAGPANASRTMRALAVAFTNEDEVAFKSVVADARKLR